MKIGGAGATTTGTARQVVPLRERPLSLEAEGQVQCKICGAVLDRSTRVQKSTCGRDDCKREMAKVRRARAKARRR